MEFSISKQKMSNWADGSKFEVEGGSALTEIPGAFGIFQRGRDPGALVSMAHKQVVHTVAGGGITETLTDAIPAGAFLVGAFGKIKTLVVMATGVSFLFGITGDTNRFGNFAAFTVNTAQDPSDHQVEATALGRFYAADTDILLTGNAGTFTSGVVTVDLFYFLLAQASDY
jgi:hypothetical protein